MQLAALLVAVHGAEFGEAQGQFLVGTRTGFIYLAVMRAVHWLDTSQPLAIVEREAKLEGKNMFLIMAPRATPLGPPRFVHLKTDTAHHEAETAEHHDDADHHDESENGVVQSATAQETFARNIGEAETGSKKQVETLAALGITTQDLAEHGNDMAWMMAAAAPSVTR